MDDSDILPEPKSRAQAEARKSALAIGGLILLLTIVGLAVLESPNGDSLVSRVAVGYTADGEALVIHSVACETQVSRVTLLRQLDGEVIWEVQGSEPHRRSVFVVGQTAAPLTVTQPLEAVLNTNETYRVEVVVGEPNAAEFLLRDVPPVGVLHEGSEATTDGFVKEASQQWCGLRGRLGLGGGLVAQLIVLLALVGVASTVAYYSSFERRE